MAPLAGIDPQTQSPPKIPIDIYGETYVCIHVCIDIHPFQYAPLFSPSPIAPLGGIDPQTQSRTRLFARVGWYYPPPQSPLSLSLGLTRYICAYTYRHPGDTSMSKPIDTVIYTYVCMCILTESVCVNTVRVQSSPATYHYSLPAPLLRSVASIPRPRALRACRRPDSSRGPQRLYIYLHL